MAFVELTGEQIRQLINTEQTYEAFRRAQSERERYRGAMAWKRVRGREYLYRKSSGVWKSLGPRGPEPSAPTTAFIPVVPPPGNV